MTKKKVWMYFCIVLIVLLTFTVISVRVESMMRIDVETVTGEIDDETSTAKIPKSCYQFDEYASMFFYVEEREGLFGTELVVASQERSPLYEEGDDVVLPSSDVESERGGTLDIISEATWPIKKGDVIVLRDEQNSINVVKQIRIFSCLVALLLPGIMLLRRSIRKLGCLQEGDVKAGIEGTVLIALWLSAVYLLMAQLKIPRQYLPPEYILDVKFYIQELRRLNFVHNYRAELFSSGACILCFWTVIGIVKWRLSVIKLTNDRKKV